MAGLKDFGDQGAANAALKVEALRTFLSHLHTPHRLDTPQIRQLLAAHRRLPHTLTPAAVGQAAARLLTDKIAALEAPRDAPAKARLPHLVLSACFLQGRKNFQAAPDLGLSERQLTRERSRALELLAAELAFPAPTNLPPEPLPPIEGHIRRSNLLRRLSEAASTHRLVAVTGVPGAGKTSLVAALAHALGPESVWWHRIRPDVNDTLEAVLVELGHALAREGYAGLGNYLGASLPEVDAGVATRLALEGLAGRRRLLVLDAFGSARDPKPIESFLQEIIGRLPLVSVVAIEGAEEGADVVKVPALTCPETAALFRARDVLCPTHVLDGVHQLAHGNTRMLAAIAAWWSGEARGLRCLERHLKGREALENLADLTFFASRGAA